MGSIFQALRDSRDPDVHIIHVIENGSVTEKALVSGGEVIWNEAGSGFISEHLDEIMTAATPGCLEMEDRIVYTEKAGSDNRLVICGAGHISMALISMGKMLGFEITVIDDRLQFVNMAIERGADHVILNEFGRGLSEVEGGTDTYFVIATRGHRYDRECLTALLAKPHAYIGMLGSRRRVGIVKEELRQASIDDGLIESIHMPIGLSIGAETPEEIAVAIMAEIIDVKSRKGSAAWGREILETILRTDRERMVLATIIRRRGSAPREAGTKMLIARDGGIVGTIGGGCMEGQVIARSRRLLMNEDPGSSLIELDMTNETAEDEGMVCGGRVMVMLETV